MEVINFEKVSKKFKKGKKLFLKQALLDLFRKNEEEDFWALKDVSFKVQKGESIGIIGANGSGKSTILKLIAGVLTPTYGKVTVSGKIGPLIELGAGFHPELSGKDNIYLNGTILGLTKEEIDRKFDEIVEFAELEDFIDTPVKHYSSGMYMRLGFSIAININPEILLIDEILAVGDINFQNKCLSVFGEFKRNNETVIFVSHSISLIEQLCQKVIFMEKGEVKYFGKPQEAILLYLKSTLNSRSQEKGHKLNEINRIGTGEVLIEKTVILGDKDREVSSLVTGRNYKIRFKYKKNREIDCLNIGIGIYRNSGEYCLGVNTYYDRFTVTSKNTIELLIKGLPLHSGEYYFNVVCFGEWENNPYDRISSFGKFVVSNTNLQRGLVALDHLWINR